MSNRSTSLIVKILSKEGRLVPLGTLAPHRFAAAITRLECGSTREDTTPEMKQGKGDVGRAIPPPRSTVGRNT